MGLLDDAIREHLELKRRRGADSSEVARQEKEAFGPPRRGDLEDDEFDEHDTLAEEAPRSLQAVEEAPWADEDDVPEPEPPTRIHTPVDVADEPEREPEREATAPPAAPAEPPAPSAGGSSRSLADEAGQPTREFDAHELRAATEVPARAPEEPEPPRPAQPPAAAPRADAEEDETGEDADVLEETPEFLQETPEHDRLWFEQRPPRDFDF